MSSIAGLPELEPAGKLILIGRKEYIAFPEWDVCRVRAKVDTGAYSSALGVLERELIEGRAGLTVRFALPSRRRGGAPRLIEAPVVKLVTVRSSSGCEQRRPLIEVPVRLGPCTRRIRLTVADRSAMRCSVLLGRQALAGAFLVNVSARYLLGDGRHGR